MSARILVTGEPAPLLLQELKEFEVSPLTPETKGLDVAEVLVAWPNRLDPGTLKKMTRLRMLQSLSAGVDALQFSAIPRGARLFSNAGAYTEPVAEHGWGLLLGIAKGLQVRGKRTVPRKLRGKTLLVVGAGEIGSEVARLSQSLEMRVIGASRSFKHPELYTERHPISELAQIIGRADAIFIAMPLSRETRGLFDFELLMRSSDNVVVANVGRGETVLEADLIRWLKERPESRYATDVFWKRDGKEVFDTPAWELPNFGGTLHNSGVPLGETLEVPYRRAAANVRKFLETGNADNEVRIEEYL